MKIEDKVHISLSKSELVEIVKKHFAEQKINLKVIDLVIGAVARDEYDVQDLREVRCEGTRTTE